MPNFTGGPSWKPFSPCSITLRKATPRLSDRIPCTIDAVASCASSHNSHTEPAPTTSPHHSHQSPRCERHHSSMSSNMRFPSSHNRHQSPRCKRHHSSCNNSCYVSPARIVTYPCHPWQTCASQAPTTATRAQDVRNITRPCHQTCVSQALPPHSSLAAAPALPLQGLQISFPLTHQMPLPP